MLSLPSRKLLTSASVTGLGMPGRACMTFNVPVTSTVDISIETRIHILNVLATTRIGQPCQYGKEVISLEKEDFIMLQEY